MPDNDQTGLDAQNKGTQSAGATGGTQSGADQQQNQGKVEDLPAWAQTLVKELRDEAAERRVALKKQETEAAQREQKRLEEEGNYRALAETHRQKADSLLPYQQKAEALEKIISDNNAQMISQIPEQMRGIVPPLAADALNAWLVKNLPLLQRKPAPDLDAGAGQGGGTKPVELTAEEKAMAAAMGLTSEAFAKQKAKNT